MVSIGTRGAACWLGAVSKDGKTVIPLCDPNSQERLNLSQALPLGTELQPAWRPLGCANDAACLWVSAIRGDFRGTVRIHTLADALVNKIVLPREAAPSEVVPRSDAGKAVSAPKYRGVAVSPFRLEGRQVKNSDKSVRNGSVLGSLTEADVKKSAATITRLQQAPAAKSKGTARKPTMRKAAKATATA